MSPGTFAVGTRVQLHGLVGASSLNGRIASVKRFDASTGRYIVQLDGNGGEKSLKPENLEKCGVANSMLGSLKASVAKGIAFTQVTLAGYSTWQLLIMLGIVLVFIFALPEIIGRYRFQPAQPATQDSTTRYAGADWSTSTDGTDWSKTAGWDMGTDESRKSASAVHEEDTFSDFRDEFRDEFRDRPPRSTHRRPRSARPPRRDMYDDDYYYDDDHQYGSGYSDYGGGRRHSGRGGGGLFSSPTSLMLIAGFAYLCYKDIIPVRRMNWFQLYMLWSFVEPLLLGGRRGGGYRRRGFF